MIIICKKLPSRGLACTIDRIDIKPLTYLELTNYCSQVSSCELDDFIWDFENLIMTIKDWEKLSSFDCFSLIAYRKMLSINLKGTIMLNDSTFSLKDIDFTDMSDSIANIREVELSTKTYRPTFKSLDSFYKTLKSFQGLTDKIKFPVIASYLGVENPNEILDLTSSDISTCEYIYPKLMCQPVVRVKGGAEVVLFGKASDLFQNILTLSPVDEKNIRL